MIVESLHPWRVTFEQAIAIQTKLASRVVTSLLPTNPQLVAGADVSYSRRTHRVYAAVVVVEFPSIDTVETAVVTQPAVFPYIRRLVSLRELSPCSMYSNAFGIVQMFWCAMAKGWSIRAVLA